MLDGGPSRMSQANDRRAAYRSANVQRQPQGQAPRQEPQVSAEPAMEQESPRRPNNKDSRRFLVPAIIAGIVVLLALVSWFVFSGMRSSGTFIESSKYQAVFLTNGDRFFGKLERVDDHQLRLTEVFFIESTTEGENPSTQSEQSDESVTRLIPLVEQSMYGPEDEMIINQEQVLFFLNLKSDSRVSQLITEYKSSN